MRRRTLPVLLAVAAAAAVVGLSGCSDEEKIAKADLLTQGDAICREVRETTQAALIEAQASGDFENETALIQQVIIPQVRGMFDRIEALGTPKGDGDRLRSIYDRVDALLDGDYEGEFSETYQGILDDLREYGFTDCAEG